MVIFYEKLERLGISNVFYEVPSQGKHDNQTDTKTCIFYGLKHGQQFVGDLQ